MGGRSGQSVRGGSNSSSDIASAIANYQSVNFEAINNELRYDKPDRFKDIIRKMDEASTDVTSDILYRGFGSDYTKTLAQKYGVKDVNNLSELKSKLIGKTIPDKGFISTTRNLSVAADFARDKGTGKTTLMQISGKKQGIQVTKHLNNYRAKKENEFIIKRGTSMKIINVSFSKTGKLILYTAIKP